jgi:sodium/hydrogen antiporter
MGILAVFFILLFLYTLLSRRIEHTVITTPIVFTVAGMLLIWILPVAHELEANRETFLRLAEIGLVFLLFTDATGINLNGLRSNESLPTRLLILGMPLTILLGLLGAVLVLPGITFWEAGILASVLAPTDAGLGEVVVTSPLVSQRIRQALNVEAGLNDGLSVPFLFLFIAIAEAGTHGAGRVLVTYAVQQLGGGILVGLVVGLLGGWFLNLAARRGWMDTNFESLGLIALPALCFILVEPLSGSMFIAAFVAGLAVQVAYRGANRQVTEFTVELGQLLDLFVFFLFGILVSVNVHLLSWRHLIYAIISLTIVRMLPVALAVRGMGLSRPTVLFMGWFGPRGLASIVLALVYIAQDANLPGEQVIFAAAMLTILVSILAHGLSAQPGIKLYARRVEKLDRAAPEFQEQAAPAAEAAQPA